MASFVMSSIIVSVAILLLNSKHFSTGMNSAVRNEAIKSAKEFVDERFGKSFLHVTKVRYDAGTGMISGLDSKDKPAIGVPAVLATRLQQHVKLELQTKRPTINDKSAKQIRKDDEEAAVNCVCEAVKKVLSAMPEKATWEAALAIEIGASDACK